MAAITWLQLFIFVIITKIFVSYIKKVYFCNRKRENKLSVCL